MALWNKDRQQNTDKHSSVDLSDVIKGMQRAVNEAEKMLEMHNLRSIKNFFHEDGDPKTIELHLTGENYLEVPILALANHNSLQIDKLTMEFEAKIQQVGIENADDILKAVQKNGTVENNSSQGTHHNTENNRERNAVFSIGFAGKADSNLLKVKLEFSSANQTEGLSRIIDEYNKLIVPYTAIEGEDASPWKNH